ncbi:MAG: hypothetical protein JSS69_17795 [Acidobacteria bacterium]|nr:hypothetical protein [Acidobacteriota bacterium]MBS1867771.1 hypothetical protein [Acidobacteriota bacterium]
MQNETKNKKAGILAASLSIVSLGLGGLVTATGQEKSKSGVVIVEGSYYCNTKALNATERARHKQLTEKLLAKRRETVETAKGYEFQYTPEDVSVAEVAEWVVAEGKCCPFFDFHIDLENHGSLVCLRLTGGDGIKAFIRSEFGLQAAG